MAIRIVSTLVARQARSVRVVAVLGACTAAVLVAPTLAGAAPHTSPTSAPHAKPTISQLQKQLGALALKNTQLVEQYDHARVQATSTAKSAKTAAATASRAARSYEAARLRYVELVQEKYESTSFGAAGALLQSSSDANYVDRMSSLDLVSSHFSQVVDDVETVRKASATTATKAAKLAASAAARRDALSKERTTVTAQIKKYKTMLSTLTSQQRAAYQRAQNPSVSPKSVNLPKATSAAAAKAVTFALAQIGKPYVFGASGPGSYDCSGLTMASWAAAGISLPHSAADQYNYGTHVSADSLQPGDLLFYYQPIGHVTIYAGDGMMVSAPTEGEDVTLVPVAAYTSDFVGATRLTS